MSHVAVNPCFPSVMHAVAFTLHSRAFTVSSAFHLGVCFLGQEAVCLGVCTPPPPPMYPPCWG